MKVFQTFPWALADFHLVQSFFLTIFNNFVFVCLFVKPIYTSKQSKNSKNELVLCLHVQTYFFPSSVTALGKKQVSVMHCRQCVQRRSGDRCFHLVGTSIWKIPKDLLASGHLLTSAGHESHVLKTLGENPAEN